MKTYAALALFGMLIGLAIGLMIPNDRTPTQWQCPACFEIVNLRDGRWPSQVPFKHPKTWPAENVSGMIVRHEYELSKLRELEGKLK